MHSADYAIASLVCLSVTRRYSVETARPKHIIKLFSLSGNQTILVYPYQKSLQYSDDSPYHLMRASNTVV